MTVISPALVSNPNRMTGWLVIAVAAPKTAAKALAAAKA
jgi:hypothetical protein